MRNKSTISTLLPFQGVNGFTNDNPTQGAASLALGILFSLCSLTRKGSDAQDRFYLATAYFSFLVYQSISLIRQK